MSLTSLLSNDIHIQKLFDTLPNIEHLFITFGYHSEPFPSYIRPLHPRVINANPPLVGTAYDFYLRSYIQKTNSKLIESNLSFIIQQGLEMLSKDKVLKKYEFQKFNNQIHEMWDRRIQYINGENIPNRVVLNDSLYFAYCEQYARSRNKMNNYMDTSLYDLNDLIKLSYATELNHKFFSTTKKIVLNPTFGFGSKLVGGADGDYIIGNTLFDVKTSNYFNYNQDFINQLLGYYLLSTYSDSFPVNVNQLALYYPRFQKIVLLKIEDVKKIFNIEKFSKYFYEYLTKNNYRRIQNPTLTDLRNGFQNSTWI